MSGGSDASRISLPIWESEPCVRVFRQIKKIKSEHDHKASTSKLVCKPKEGRKPWANSQSFRDSATYRRDQQGGGDRKRKWAGYKPRGSNAKYSKTGGGARRASDSNQAASNNLS